MAQLLKAFTFVNFPLSLVLCWSLLFLPSLQNVVKSTSDFSTQSSLDIDFSNDITREDGHQQQTSVLVSVRQTLDDAKELIRSITESFSAYVPQITEDLKKLMVKIAGRISNALEEFNAELIKAGESVLRDMVRNLDQQLLRLDEEFQRLADISDDQFYGLVDYLNNTLINQTETIDHWARHLKQELRSVNNTRLYKEGCTVVDSFMLQATDELRDCCNIAVKPVYSLCRKVRQVLAEAFHVLVDALDHMQTCLEDKHSYLEYMVPCVHVAYDDVSALISRAAQLRHNLTTMMPMKVVFSKFCILIVSVHIEQRQHKMEETMDARMNMEHDTKWASVQ